MAPDPDGRFAGILDVFGDGSFWALWTPGHTPGSTSYLARTARGPVLFTGDVCHTRFGWENDVEPGSYLDDRGQAIESLARLRRLWREHPAMDVRLGHQFLSDAQRRFQAVNDSGKSPTREHRPNTAQRSKHGVASAGSTQMP